MRVWAETSGDHPDGICLDSEGAIWNADVANKHCVRGREGGEVLDTVDLDRVAFACALSGGIARTSSSSASRDGRNTGGSWINGPKIGRPT